MKVTRLRKGYRINVTEAEMGMLRWLSAGAE